MDRGGAIERLVDEQQASEYLNKEGIKVKNFGDVSEVRDHLESLASFISDTSRDVSEKGAVSHYLEAIQKPELKPEEVIDETNKLLVSLRKSGNPDHDSTLTSMTKLTEGLAAHYDVPDTANTRIAKLAFDSQQNVSNVVVPHVRPAGPG